jgi:hypothetical protein
MNTNESYNRRTFIKTTTAGAFLGSTAPLLAAKSPNSETLAATLFKSLTDEQRKKVTFPWDHELRNRVDNNWRIVTDRIFETFNEDQQQMIKEIFLSLHSEQYAQQVLRQVETDNGKGGMGKCAVAMFGEPGTGKFEFVFTGRHVTRRCDGDAVEGAAFGGPIFYGHAAQHFNEKPGHPDNIYWFQAKRANELFQALDGKQRKQALLQHSRGEHGTKTVALKTKVADMEGLPMSGLSSDQQELADLVMHDLLAPFRKVDREESMKLIKKNGFEDLHLSYFQKEDIGDDGVWDVWQIEGPRMVWYFRGKPHVHTWVNIKA